ncbi:MAG TPA: polysaccharide deacetylase family protein [Candidatus Binatia bacterium]|jgi:peptidoglycan/xylan/chitin deacetylase (PgdA/CDA1 family)|nr:polysaccharide deacetylase family protein [Candidatus Binatia bacterium]
MQNCGLTTYSSLKPFRACFETGLPILTYHKLGPRPPRARLKGLYLSQKLFLRQLHELKQAGFQSASLSDWVGAGSAPNRRLVLTFDDGFRNVLEYGLEPLRQHRFGAIQFLVAGQIGRPNDWEVAEGEAPAGLMDAAQVRQWLAAGHEIGSHSLSHPRLTRLPLEQAREEVSGSKKKLEDCFSRPIEHFCYPYGDWSPAVRDLVAEAGYRTACTTEPGVNTDGADPFALKRFTARYPSRNLKAIWARLRLGLKVED